MTFLGYWFNFPLFWKVKSWLQVRILYTAKTEAHCFAPPAKCYREGYLARDTGGIIHVHNTGAKQTHQV